jgi:anti-anti-sigma regulatory factor
MDPSQEARSLTYQITQKNSVLVVALSGALVRENVEALERLHADLGERTFSWVVLHFKAVPDKADRTVLPALARIQKTIRDKGGQVRLSSLHPNLRMLLQERGVLRHGEYVDDLAETLQWLAKGT